jgi:hypothetical protein
VSSRVSKTAEGEMRDNWSDLNRNQSKAARTSKLDVKGEGNIVGVNIFHLG